LQHNHIVRVLEFGVEGDTPYLVMEYAPNGTLRQRYPRGKARQIAAALQYVHNEHLVHGNLRPENILLGLQNQLLLSDFSTTARDQSAIPTRTLPATGQSMTGVWD
jgi:serine/threonine protein kinase